MSKRVGLTSGVGRQGGIQPIGPVGGRLLSFLNLR
jgi:hypothetical protein